ncbi:MAG: ABC transporter permease [Bacteroidetes bacterium]|nr:ABC transporter permease [Bacteroidota bacterium]
MLKNYLLFIFRSFSRDKFYTILNILGLAVGLASVILIILFLKHELTYDTHHQNRERIFRVSSHFQTVEMDLRFAYSSSPMAPLMKDEFPEIEQFVRFRQRGKTLLTYREKDGRQKVFYEDKILYADSAVFKVFTHPFIVGDPNTALEDLYSIVLTQSVAEKYFSKEEILSGAVIGKEIQVEDLYTAKITGVIEDLPENSHLQFRGLISYGTLFRNGQPDFSQIKEMLWTTPDFTYFLLPANYDPASINTKFKGFFDKYMGEFGTAIGATFDPVFEPLASIHYYSDVEQDLPRGNAAYIYAFGLIAILLLLLASINYMNMATARSAQRAREVGMRKVLGSSHRQLIYRFLGESVLMALMAFFLAIFITETIISFSPLMTWLGKNLSASIFSDYLLLGSFAGISIIVGLLSGLYPAFYLSRFEPVKVLKSAAYEKNEGGNLRRVLVGLQFVISIGVVLCTLLMQSQIDFVRNTFLGFNKENILLVNIQDEKIHESLTSFSEELRNIPGVLNTTTAAEIPGDVDNTRVYYVEGKEGLEKQLLVFNWVDANFLDLMGIEIKSGRGFSEEMGTDSTLSYLVNESLVRKMGWEDPIGKKVSGDIQMDGSPGEIGQVIGVIGDYHFRSLHNQVEPLILQLNPRPGGYLHVKVQGNNLVNTIASIEDKWQEFGASYPFEYSFLDQNFDQLYREDERQSKLLNVLAFICIFVSCLGLLGLTSFSIEKRNKEVGIRKVLGASMYQIVSLLFKDIFVLVLVSLVLAIPMSVFVIQKWLESFAYQVDLGVGIFLWVGIGALFTSFLTVGYHIIRAANRNPVDTLKYE